MKKFKSFVVFAILATLLIAAIAHAFNPMDVAKALFVAGAASGAVVHSEVAPAVGQIETAFSPDGGAEALGGHWNSLLEKGIANTSAYR